MRDRGQYRLHLRARVGFLVFGFSLLFQTFGVERVLAQEAGEPGGVPFTQRCPGNEADDPDEVRQYMVGAAGSTGWYVDQIQIFCAAIGPDGLWTAPPVPLDSAGAPGATSYAQMCANGSVVTAISGKSGTYIDSIALTCTPVDGDQATTFQADGGLGGTIYKLEAPSEPTRSAVFGITGTSGWWISSLDIVDTPVCIQPPNTVTLLGPFGEVDSARPTFSWAMRGIG